MFFSAGFTILVSSLAVVAQNYGGPPAPAGTTAATSSTPAPAPSAPPSTASDINVNVAPNETFTFSPNQITAPNGTTVTFWFPNNGLTHSVTQSSFTAPCTYLTASANSSAGFDSGLTADKQFTIVITDDSKPIWFHCKQLLHCGMGMVGSINAPANGTNTFAAFQAAASKIGSSEPQESDTGAVTGGFDAIASNAPSATGSGVLPSAPPSSGMRASVSIGAILLAGVAMGAALL